MIKKNVPWWNVEGCIKSIDAKHLIICTSKVFWSFQFETLIFEYLFYMLSFSDSIYTILITLTIAKVVYLNPFFWFKIWFYNQSISVGDPTPFSPASGSRLQLPFKNGWLPGSWELFLGYFIGFRLLGAVFMNFFYRFWL